MELNIAVVDDLPDDRRTMTEMLNRYFYGDKNGVHITEYASAEDFLQIYKKGAFQIVFLDIYLGGIGGIELSQRLRTGDPEIEIIFMSSTVDQMINAFPVKPSGYLYKPYTYEKFSQAVGLALKSFSREIKTYTIKLPKAEISVPFSEIMSAVADKHTSDITLISGIVHKCMKPYAEVSADLLKESCFIECNRGVVINMDYVLLTKEMESKVTLQGGMSFPVRHRDRKDIASRLTVYLATKLKGGLNV